MDLKPCPFCGSDAEVERDSNIFVGQRYSDRYPEDVANQDHGFRVRCVKCGGQTCWWHYKWEAINNWNLRHLSNAPAQDASENCFYRGGHGCQNVRLDVPWK